MATKEKKLKQEEIQDEPVKIQIEDEPVRLTPSSEKSETKTLKEEGDYLRQYQYGREMPLGSAGTNPAPGSKAGAMKQFLLGQPRVRIIIPRGEGESSTVRLSVNLNGYRLDLPKQTYIEVPEDIAKVIMDSQKQTEQALQYMRIDRNKGTEEALA